MKLSWFESYIRDLLPREYHDHRALLTAAKLAMKLAKLNGYTTYGCLDGSNEINFKQRMVYRFEKALARAIESGLNHESEKKGGFCETRFLKVKGWSEGVGEDLSPSAKVVPISDGVGKALCSLLNNELTSQEASIYKEFKEDFKASISLRTLIHVLEKKCHIRANNDENVLQLLCEELCLALRWFKSNAVQIDFGNIRDDHRSTSIDGNNLQFDSFDSNASLIFNSQYPKKVGEIIDRAEYSIRLAVFYLVPGSEGVNDLINKLVKAKDRGVDVEVVLSPNSEKGCQNINTFGYKLLSTKGIDVFFEHPSNLKHSKVLVVDKKISVIGSHNWTAGSFYAFEDISIAIESTHVASAWEDWYYSIRNPLNRTQFNVS